MTPLSSPGVYSKESIPSAYVAFLEGPWYNNPFPTQFLAPVYGSGGQIDNANR